MGPEWYDYSTDDPIAKLLANESRLCHRRKAIKEDYNVALATYDKEGSSMVPILGQYFTELTDNTRVCKAIRSVIESKADTAGDALPESPKIKNALNKKITTDFNTEFEQIQANSS